MHQQLKERKIPDAIRFQLSTTFTGNVNTCLESKTNCDGANSVCFK